MDIYAENILEHYRNPRNRKARAKEENPKTKDALATRNKQPSIVSYTEENLSCGDSVTVHLTIEDDRIKNLSWEGEGCAISQAAMSMLSEEIKGQSTAAITEYASNHVLELLGVPIGPRRMKCALLGLLALQNALRKYRS